jgi:F-type H+-transporting ATPase subunit epsilon
MRETMTLKILLPQRVYATIDGIEGIVAENLEGAFGLLPHRRDCVAALAPGILTYVTAAGQAWLAIDQGLLLKTGLQVRVVAHAVQAGKDLAELRAAVVRHFLAIDDNERAARRAMQKLESGFIHALGTQHE